MSRLAAATASWTLGRVAETPTITVAWSGVAVAVPLPTTVMVVAVVEAARAARESV